MSSEWPQAAAGLDVALRPVRPQLRSQDNWAKWKLSPQVEVFDHDSDACNSWLHCGSYWLLSHTDNMAVDKFEKKTSLEISYFIRDIICQTMPSQYKLWCHGMPRFQMEPKSSPVLWKYSSKSLSSDSQSTLVELVACAWSSGSPSQACYTLQLVVLIESKRPGLPRHWALSAADVHIKYFPGPHRLHSEINFR